MAQMARFYRGSPVSAAALNEMAQEIDYQGLTCKVRRSAVATPSPNIDYIIDWNVQDYDAAEHLDDVEGGMWDPIAPTYIIIRANGTYAIEAQLRFQHLSTGSPYNTGQRASKILINSTDVFSTDPAAGPVTSTKEGWSVDGEGVTLSLHATVPLEIGDRVYVNLWHSATGAIQALQSNYGGTYLAVTRTAGLPQ